MKKDFDTFLPTKILICTCEQCRYIKNMRKNRKLKKKLKRLFNKRIRKGKGGKIITFHWS